jgi:hypothetical protein
VVYDAVAERYAVRRCVGPFTLRAHRDELVSRHVVSELGMLQRRQLVHGDGDALEERATWQER